MFKSLVRTFLAGKRSLAVVRNERFCVGLAREFPAAGTFVVQAEVAFHRGNERLKLGHDFRVRCER